MFGLHKIATLQGQNIRKRTLIIASAAIIATAGGGGIAAAAGVTLPFSGDGNTINGCYSPGGQLKLLTPVQSTCPHGMTPIQWNVTGPQGPAGPTGPTGPKGASFLTSDGPPSGACTTGDSDVDYTTGEVYQCQSGSWVDTKSSLRGPQGPAGVNAAAGQSCPSGQYVSGFDSSGNVVCTALPTSTTSTTQVTCPANTQFTFSVTSVSSNSFWYWPGGQQTKTVSGDPNCSVTVANPSGLISDIGGTAGTNGWSIVSWTGFTSAEGTVDSPSCNSLSISSVTAGNYPTCSDSSTLLTGSSSDNFVVTAS